MIREEVYSLNWDGTITVPRPGVYRVQVNERRSNMSRLIPASVPRRRKGDDERRHPVPRRITTRTPIIEGAVYGTQMVGKRKALFSRRMINGVRESVGPDFRTERRDPNRIMYQYRTSQDPRIRALERRGAVTRLERRVGPHERRVDRRAALWCKQFRREKPWDYDRRKG